MTKLNNIAILPKRYKLAYFALVAQLAEHIHGKDKVISSILIEGWVLAWGKIYSKSAEVKIWRVRNKWWN